MVYDTKTIMADAWRNHRRDNVSFSIALHRAWMSAKARPLNDKKVEATKVLLGIDEEVKTYADWQKAGFKVIHGSKALFKVDLVWQSKGEGVSYKASFFGKSQVQKIA